MQAEFVEYIRVQARDHTKVVVALFMFLATLTLLRAYVFISEDADVEEKSEMLQTSLVLGVPALLTSIILLISRKNMAFVELVTPLMFIGFVIALALINLTEVAGEVTERHRT